MSLGGHRVGGTAFACADGRIFDIVNVVVQESRGTAYSFGCTVEIFERDAEDQFPEFDFRFFATAFDDGVCGRAAKSIADYSLNWVVEWLEVHRSVPYANREGRPIVIEVR